MVSVAEIIAAKGIGRLSLAETTAAARAAIAKCPRAVAYYRAGNALSLNAIVGHVLAKTHGIADAREAISALRAELD